MTVKDEVFQVYSYGLIYASVCTNLDVEEATRRLNAEHPTGVSSEWRVADEGFRSGEPNPTPCNQGSGAMHYLFSC